MASYSAHHLDDFEAGQTFETPGQTMTEATVQTYAGVSGDHTRLHTDAEYARETEFGERIVHGPLTFACTTGLLLRTGLLTGTIHSFLGVDAMQFPRPVYFEDTITATATVTETRELDSRDDVGVVVFDTATRNQHGETVLETPLRFMIRSKDSCENSDQINGTGGDR